jgi:hypothetical protein
LYPWKKETHRAVPGLTTCEDVTTSKHDGANRLTSRVFQKGTSGARVGVGIDWTRKDQIGVIHRQYQPNPAAPGPLPEVSRTTQKFDRPGRTLQIKHSRMGGRTSGTTLSDTLYGSDADSRLTYEHTTHTNPSGTSATRDVPYGYDLDNELTSAGSITYNDEGDILGTF